MNTEKPTKLIQLLDNLISETEKINVGRIYIAVIEETNRIQFVQTATNPFSETVYKNLIRLSIKDFIHSGRAIDSIEVIREVMEVISHADIVSGWSVRVINIFSVPAAAVARVALHPHPPSEPLE